MAQNRRKMIHRYKKCVFRSLPDLNKQTDFKCPRYVGKYGQTDEQNIETHYFTLFFSISPLPRPLDLF